MAVTPPRSPTHSVLTPVNSPPRLRESPDKATAKYRRVENIPPDTNSPQRASSDKGSPARVKEAAATALTNSPHRPAVVHQSPSGQREEEAPETVVDKVAGSSEMGLERPRQPALVLRPPRRFVSRGPDRFIPDRQIMREPGVATFNTPRPPSPQNAIDRTYQVKLAEALLGCRHPHDHPVLRRASSSALKIESEPFIPLDEVYGMRATIKLDLPGILDDFYTMPAAYSQESDRIAFILNGMPFTDPDGAVKTGAQVYLYDPKAKSHITLFPVNALYGDGDRPVSVAFNQKGNYLVLGKNDGSVEAWSLKETPPVKKFEINPATVLGKTIARINSVLAADHMIFAGDNLGGVYRIDPKTGNVIDIPGHGKGICNIVVSPNGRYLVTGGNDNKIIIRFAKTLEIVGEFSMNAGIRGIAFDPEKECRIAVGGGQFDPRICIFNFRHPEQEKMVEIPGDSQVTNITWEKKNRMISTHRDGTYRVIPLRLNTKYPFGTILPIQAEGGRILFSAIRQSGNEKTLMCVGGGESFQVFSMPSEKGKQNREPSIFEDPFKLLR